MQTTRFHRKSSFRYTWLACTLFCCGLLLPIQAQEIKPFHVDHLIDSITLVENRIIEQQVILAKKLSQYSSQQNTRTLLTQSIQKDNQDWLVLKHIIQVQEDKKSSLTSITKHTDSQIAMKVSILRELENQHTAQHAQLADQRKELINQKEFAWNQNQVITRKFSQLRNEGVFLKKQLQAIEAKKKVLLNRSKALHGQQFMLIVFILFITLLLLFSAFVFRRLKQRAFATTLLRTQNLKIENNNEHLQEQNFSLQQHQDIVEQNNEIIYQGLVYAKQIQQSILPPVIDLKNILNESFVLFSPKDVVSGDFYLFHKVDSSLLVGAVDCTGHGVPGAFMTMIGSKRFQRAITKTLVPGEILKEVNQAVKLLLHQSDRHGTLRDGMDAALINVNLETYEITFSGANRPLWVIQAKNPTQILEIKGTRVSLGGITKADQEFETHTVQLELNDSVYLFSNGYADQFSEANQKMLPFRAKEKLLEICSLPMQQQALELETFLQTWKGNSEQTDDVMAIGIKLC